MSRVPDESTGDSFLLRRLLRDCAGGDEQAFAQLYDATAKRVYGLVLAVLRDPAQSEEVTQEVYLTVWRSAGSFDPDLGSPLSWLLMLAHRKAVDRVRAGTAQQRRDVDYGLRAQEPARDLTAETAGRKIEGERVRAAVGELTPVQSEAVALAYFGGYTHVEIAGLLQVPLGTAKSRIRDGLRQLRTSLGAQE